jgi:hypothetical protein
MENVLVLTIPNTPGNPGLHAYMSGIKRNLYVKSVTCCWAVWPYHEDFKCEKCGLFFPANKWCFVSPEDQQKPASEVEAMEDVWRKQWLARMDYATPGKVVDRTDGLVFDRKAWHPLSLKYAVVRRLGEIPHNKHALARLWCWAILKSSKVSLRAINGWDKRK